MEKILKKEIKRGTEIFKLLSDPTRLRILYVLYAAKREICVNEIAQIVGATQSATSHQLAKLEDKGIVSAHRVGQTICYEIIDNPLTSSIKKAITQLT